MRYGYALVQAGVQSDRSHGDALRREPHRGVAPCRHPRLIRDEDLAVTDELSMYCPRVRLRRAVDVHDGRCSAAAFGPLQPWTL